MARPRSERITAIKADLVAKLQHGYYRAGNRFLSARALAARYAVSYQTAHVLLRELVEAGMLVRRAASGTFLPGADGAPGGALLVFNSRAARPGSFGAMLLAALEEGLRESGTRFEVVLLEPDRSRSLGSVEPYPVVWDLPPVVHRLAGERRYGLLLNENPPPGIASSYLDSVASDDFSGGATAAELLAGVPNPVVLGGPESDPRSRARVDGFRSLVPEAPVVWAPTWFYDSGLAAAGEVWAMRPGGIFCANDRLASAVLAAGRDLGMKRVPLIGFDDAPVAAEQRITTIAIPVREMVESACTVIARRIAGDSRAAQRQIFSLRPVVRD